jgi:hypothetical protein
MYLLVVGVWFAGCNDSNDPPFADGPTPVDAPVLDASALPPAPPEHEVFEAVGHLIQIQNGLRAVVAEHGEYPADIVTSFTPAASCCAGQTSCPPNPAAWENSPAWSELGFVIQGAHQFTYSIRSPARTAVTVTARGDRDCDGTTSDIVMDCVIDAGLERCQMSFPGIRD